MSSSWSGDIADSWRDRAACKGTDTSLFFVEVGETTSAQDARNICATCPVETACLDYALRNEHHGIWGRTTEQERRKLRRKQRIYTADRELAAVGRTPVYRDTCGSAAGYRAHLRRTENACDMCKTANSTYVQRSKTNAS